VITLPLNCMPNHNW